MILNTMVNFITNYHLQDFIVAIQPKKTIASLNLCIFVCTRYNTFSQVAEGDIDQEDGLFRRAQSKVWFYKVK